MPHDNNPLPYTDTKPVGAADFYFAINATFRFILTRLGMEGLRRYWADMGASYYQPVTERWRHGVCSSKRSRAPKSKLASPPMPSRST
jgi:hypothetical protein